MRSGSFGGISVVLPTHPFNDRGKHFVCNMSPYITENLTHVQLKSLQKRLHINAAVKCTMWQHSTMQSAASYLNKAANLIDSEGCR